MRTFDVAEFQARRRADQDRSIESIETAVGKWLLDPNEQTRDEVLGEVVGAYQRAYRADNGAGEPHASTVAAEVASILSHSSPDTNATTLATLLAINAMNAAAQQAAADDPEPLLLEWVTMHDNEVRPTHRDADGERRPPGQTYEVGGEHLLYPGQPVGDPSVWINCRCVLAPVTADTARLQGPVHRTSTGVAMTITSSTANTFAVPVAPPVEAESTESVAPIVVPWHGVLAPEGKWSGDGRRFAENSLTTRDLPLPLTWQKTSDDGHKGSVTVAKIAQVDRVDGEMRATGTFLASPEADEVVGLLAEFGRFGVSVDADDTEFEFDDESQQVTFTAARIASASIVPIPAFAEAWVSLGEPPDGFLPVADLTASVDEFVSDKPWSNFKQSDYTPAQWKSACVMHLDPAETPMSNHKLPIKEPGGALNRNGVHAAAARFNQTQGPAEAKAAAKSALRGAYKQIGEDPPDVLKASLHAIEEWGRGPGWLTDPIATKRIHDYWTVPGQEGYAKIGWGTEGDFNRCKVEVGQEIAEKDPEKVARYMNQICAQWHHDALGRWPAEDKGGDAAEVTAFGDTPAPAISLVAAGPPTAPASWFTDPHLDKPTHLTVSDDGRVYGHIAQWGTCHIGFNGVCVEPPTSASDYAYFATGQVLLDDGTAARTGVISLGGGHAGRGGLRATTAHYDSTSTAVADVAVGEDEHGIWCAGWVRPGTSEDEVVALRASDVSGDWREVAGQMEMVAALAVNVAGFPVARVEDGRQVMLVAAGVVAEAPDEMDEFADRIVAAMERRQQAAADRIARMKQLAERVRRDH